MSFDPTVRLADPASATDVGQLDLLESDARAALIDQRGGSQWLAEHPRTSPNWPARIAAPGVDVWVAYLDDIVVGYLVAVLGDDHVIRVDQVWVDPLARENGFGDLLLERAIERAQAFGATAVEGQSLPGDRHTKNLYERAGIVARLITTYRTL